MTSLIITRGFGKCKGEAQPVVVSGGEVITQEKPRIYIDRLVTKDAPDTSQPLKVIVESVHD